jgi:hypothetical protein
MRRQTFLCCRPCLVNLRRHASTNQYRPTTALASALLSHNSQLESQEKKKKKNRASKTTIDVVNPTTAETFTIDLNRVKPLTEEYALLPRQHRQYVEKRHLRTTLRQRTKQEYDVPIDKDDPLYKPEESLADKFIKEEFQIRGLKEDDPITFSQQQSIQEIANERAKEVEEEELNRRKLAALARPLTFEEQWKRRDSYGTHPPPINCPLISRRQHPQSNETSNDSSLQSLPRPQKSHQTPQRHHRTTPSRRLPHRPQQILRPLRHETLHLGPPRHNPHHKPRLHPRPSPSRLFPHPRSLFPSRNNPLHREPKGP